MRRPRSAGEPTTALALRRATGNFPQGSQLPFFISRLIISSLVKPVTIMINQDTAARLSFELHGAARLLRRNFDRRAREHDLSRSRWQVLWVLAQHQGAKQAELAERLDVAPISLGRQLDNLENEGLIERRRDAGDRRCFRIHLTPAAQPVLQTLKVLAEETRCEALAGLSQSEVVQLHELLGRIRANLSGEET